MIDDVKNIFLSDRFKVKAVTRIEVGANRLRIVVDDNCAITHLPEGPNAMNAGVIELNPLADADGT